MIIGFDQLQNKPAQLFTYSTNTSEPVHSEVPFINAYLANANSVFVEQRRQPLSSALPPVTMGSMPRDGGHLLINTVEEYEKVMSDPIAAKYVKRYAMGYELINNIPRWCLWLEDADPADLRNSPALKERLFKVAESRRKSAAPSTQQMAETPHLFGQRSQSKMPYLAIPKVFSETRRYATVDFLPSEVIAGDKIYKCDDPDGFAFAIASSSMFITWQKSIGGRLKSDPSFSNTLVWNNLPLGPIGEDLKTAIIAAGSEILEYRRSLPKASLADLYNPLGMNPTLIKLHNSLDKLVDRAFGAQKALHSNGDREAELFRAYAQLI